MFSILSTLLPSGIKSYLTIFVVAVVLAVVGTFAWKYRSAISTIDEMQQEKITLEKEKALLEHTNNQNQSFIQNMQANLAAQEKLVSDFRIQKARDDKKMSDLAKIIGSYSAADDGPLAKVLKDTLIGIQQDREARSK